jgi:anti-anti-sigma factor
MEIHTEQRNGTTVHRIAGRLDTSSGAAVEAAVRGSFAASGSRLLFDMRDVIYVSSAGVRVVLLAAKQAKATNGRFALFGLSPSVREVFEISGLGKILHLLDSEDEAFAAVGA